MPEYLFPWYTVGMKHQKRDLIPFRNLEKKPIWEKQPRETYTAFDQFRLYREMGSGRSFTAVANEVGVRADTIAVRARLWQWRERVAAWEQHLDKLRQEEFEQEGRSMARRHARIGMLLQNKAEEAVGMLVFDANDNRPSAKDVAVLADTGVKMERAARGENTNEGQQVVIQLNTVPAWAKSSPVIVATPNQALPPSEASDDSKV